MMYSMLAVVMLGALGLYGVCKAHFNATRQVAGVTLAMAAVELLLAGVLEIGALPVLTVVLMVCRLAMAGLCVLSIREDGRAFARRKSRRAACARQMVCAAHPVQALPQTKPVCIRTCA